MLITALIPARLRSKRIPGKNIKDFFGHPLIAYTIQNALNSGIYDEVIVSTDSQDIAQIAYMYGASYIIRPEEYGKDDSPDIDWIKHALGHLDGFKNGRPDILCILRPTNPFRSKKMLIDSLKKFTDGIGFDSMRAIEPVSQHPHKMWQIIGSCIEPVLNKFDSNDDFTKPTQFLPEYFVQNGSLEIIWTRTIEKYGNVCGGNIMPYITEGLEGFDINDLSDWILAEELVRRRMVKLPRLNDKRI